MAPAVRPFVRGRVEPVWVDIHSRAWLEDKDFTPAHIAPPAILNPGLWYLNSELPALRTTQGVVLPAQPVDVSFILPLIVALIVAAIVS